MRQEYPFYFQSAVHDCVPTCILSVANYYGITISLKKLRQVLVTDPMQGTPLKNLQNLQPFMQVQLGKITEYENLQEYFPFVAYLQRNHAIVVWSYAENQRSLIVGDPSIGLITMRQEDFFRQWEGLTAIIRPLSHKDFEFNNPFTLYNKENWQRWFDTAFHYLGVKWSPLLWISFVIILLGAANAFYSLNYAKYLQDFYPFLLLVTSFTAITGVLNWLAGYMGAKFSLRFAEQLGWKIRDALPKMDRKFYTMGDVSTRYSDAVTVVTSIIGLYQDIPYSVVIFGASMYFLCKISFLLGVFVIAFLALLICILSPFVNRVQSLTYTTKIRDSQMMNRLRNYLQGGHDDVNESWEESLHSRYKQSIWAIPISSTVSNSAVLPVLFVVIFLHWKNGGVSQYQDLLSALMIMNYAVSAGHNLYGRYVAWKTAQPSFHRLKDFLEIDQDEQERTESIVS